MHFDLTNAQLAIASTVWDVREIRKHLEREGSIWPYLLRVVRDEHDLSESAAKDALKKAIYSIAFGMSRGGIQYTLGKALTFRNAVRFLKDPLITALFEGRERALARIDEDDGATDVFGVRYEVVDEVDGAQRGHMIRSALAATMQAIEFDLLLPVVRDAAKEIANQKPLYRIVSWLYDGFTIRLRSKTDQVTRRLTRLVDERAKALGIPTHLSVEML